MAEHSEPIESINARLRKQRDCPGHEFELDSQVPHMLYDGSAFLFRCYVTGHCIHCGAPGAAQAKPVPAEWSLPG